MMFTMLMMRAAAPTPRYTNGRQITIILAAVINCCLNGQRNESHAPNYIGPLEVCAVGPGLCSAVAGRLLLGHRKSRIKIFNWSHLGDFCARRCVAIGGVGGGRADGEGGGYVS